MSFLKATGSQVFITLIAIAAMCFTTGAIAEQNKQGSSSAQAASPSQVAEVREKIKKISGRLQKIQKQTLASNEDLVKQQTEFQGILDGVMKDNGFNSTTTLDRLKVIAEKLQAGNVSQEDQQRLQQEYQQKSQQLQLAQREAMQNEDVQSARSAYIEDLVSAMKEQHPKAEQLISELNTAQQQYQAMVQASMNNNK